MNEARTPAPALGTCRRDSSMLARATRAVSASENGENRVIAGHAAVFFRADDPGTEYYLGWGMRERFAPGAFAKSIADDTILALWEHRRDQLLGRNRPAGTLRLSESGEGLRFEIDVPDTELGRSIATLVSRGDIVGASLTFVPGTYEIEETEGRDGQDGETIITHTQVQSIEDVGPVSVPAYDATSVGLSDRSRFRTPEQDGAHHIVETWRAARRAERLARARAYADRARVIGCLADL